MQCKGTHLSQLAITNWSFRIGHSQLIIGRKHPRIESMNIVLLGMKHCGKSTVGRALAERWDCPFHDVDDRIEAAYAREANLLRSQPPLSVRQIFATHGEEYFNQIEQQTIHSLADEIHQLGQPTVLSLGGRPPLNPALHDLLPELGTGIYLKVDPQELFRRIEANGLPPFLETDDPFAEFFRLIDQREPAYRRLADLTVDLDGLDRASAFERVLNQLEEYRQGLK